MKNNTTPSADKFHKTVFWAICVILFLPILLLPPNFQPSDWSRIILFRLILTALVFFAAFAFLAKKEIAISLPKIKSRVWLPLFALLGFLFTLVISTIFSENAPLSFFGVPTRTGGLLTLSFFVIFPLILALFIKEKYWDKLLKINLIVGGVVSLLAIIQFFNLFKNIFLSYEGGRAPSFLGNSTFVAIYLLFLSFLCLIFLTREQNTNKKMGYAGLLGAFLFTILITAARATYLGLVIGFIFFLLFYPKKIKRVKIITLSLLALVALAIFLFNAFPKIAQKSGILGVAAERLSLQTLATDLAGTRFSAWKITLQAIKERPMFGWGSENFYVGFEKYFDPLPSNLHGLWWDRPHNIFLDVFATSGILALILYVCFWIFILWRLQIYKKQQMGAENAYIAHGIQAMFIGYLVSLFFNFDGFATYLISFFFIGYSFYLLSEQEEKIIILPPKTLLFQKKPVIALALLLLVPFIWFWNIKPLYLNAKISYISNLADSQKCDQALTIADSGNWQKAGMIKSYAALKYADLVKKCAPNEKGAEYAKKALDFLKVGILYQPEYTRTWLFMGSFANVLAAADKNPAEQKKLLQQARDYFQKALELSPKRGEIAVEQQKNYLLEKDYEAMKSIGENCIAIDSKQAGCYWYLGIAQIFLGDQASGKKNIQLAREKGLNSPSYLQLGVAYINQKNYVDAANAYYELLKIYPENASYHATLAILYRHIGKYTEAGLEAMEVFKLQPDNEETLPFIKGLIGFKPNDPELHFSLAYIYAELGENEKARQEYLILKSIYLQLINQYPKNDDYHYYLAVVYKELGEYANAEREAYITLKLDELDYSKKIEALIGDLPREGNYWDRYLRYLDSR